MRLLVVVAAVACAAPPKKAAPKKPQWHGCDEVRHWAASHRHDHTPATGWGGVFKGAVSHSQFGQDLVIVSIVQSLSKMNVSTWSPPFSYVDLATNDPLEGSNTFLLDACFSWKGVCVEPNAVYREAILEKRSCPLVDTCVSDGERTVKFVNDFSLGHVVGRRLKPELTELRCTTLRRILEGRSPRVTYLSLELIKVRLKPQSRPHQPRRAPRTDVRAQTLARRRTRTRMLTRTHTRTHARACACLCTRLDGLCLGL